MLRKVKVCLTGTRHGKWFPDISTSVVNTGEDYLVRFHHNDSDMSFSPLTARNDKVEVLEKPLGHIPHNPVKQEQGLTSAPE